MSVGSLPTEMRLSILFIFPFITDIVSVPRFDRYISPLAEFTVKINGLSSNRISLNEFTSSYAGIKVE